MSYPVMSTSIPWGLVKGGFHKSTAYNTVKEKTAAGCGDVSFAMKPYPTWDFVVDLLYVPGGESVQGSVLQSFLGTYIQTGGGRGYFLFTDPNDRTVTTAQGCMLNVTPTAGNLVQNPGFEMAGAAPGPNWTAVGAPISYLSSGQYDGTQSLGLSSFAAVWQTTDTNPTIGANYTLTGYAKTVGGVTGSIGLYFYNSSGAQITSNSIGTTSPTWVPLTVSQVCPSGAAKVEVYCFSGAGQCYFDDLQLIAPAFTPMGMVGDGASTQFQLARTISGGVDLLQNVAITGVYLNGTPTVAYSVSDTGVVTFATAPGVGQAITWAGSFQYLCQFDDDTLESLARVSKNSANWIWDCPSIKFESVFV